jgi:hypothetical protein
MKIQLFLIVPVRTLIIPLLVSQLTIDSLLLRNAEEIVKATIACQDLLKHATKNLK